MFVVECVENRCQESAPANAFCWGDIFVVVVHGITRIFSKNILDCQGVLCEEIVTSSGKENTKKGMFKKMSNRKTTMSHARIENVIRVL
jgi:hypothetical protein